VAVESMVAVTMLLDSGASNHYFVERGQFTTYKSISPAQIGHSDGKNSTFLIEDIVIVGFTTKTDRVASRVTMSESLHTPQLCSNLISVSKLVSKRSTVSFKGMSEN
jgi:hypothetical protein